LDPKNPFKHKPWIIFSRTAPLTTSGGKKLCEFCPFLVFNHFAEHAIAPQNQTIKPANLF
jgi:hypothetical protein